MKNPSVDTFFYGKCLVNDRIGLKRDSAETEASARSTEASAEASAESLATKSAKMLAKFSQK